MSRRFALRFATLFLVIFTTAAPVFAAARRDDSPMGGIERAITRIIKQVKKVLVPGPNDNILNVPKP
jgi:hypothetical protein